MAKQVVNQAAAVDLTAAQKREIARLKKPIMSVSDAFMAARVKLRELAPAIFALLGSIKAQNPAFTFVEFCRQFDPSVPTHAADKDGRPGYRNHKVYQTLNYAQRTLQPKRGKGTGTGVRGGSTEALARAIATMLALGIDAKIIWDAIKAEYGWGERIMSRLEKRVAKVDPFFSVSLPKNAHVKVGNVIHMERAGGAVADGEGEALAQPGRRVRVA